MLEKLAFRNIKAKENRDEPFNLQNIPNHIAIIMDGNGRWAKGRGLPRIAGHREGMKIVKKIVREASDLGVGILTLYAFSTENWKRPKDEVDFLMRLPEQFLTTYLKELVEKNVQVRVIGDESRLPIHTKRAIDQAKQQTLQNDGMVLNFALNYGSRHEITEAIRQIAEDTKKGLLDAETIDESTVSEYLLTKAYPDPDLLIRTSGELRLSNFMLWQLAYTELWFTKVYWPDFTEDHLKEAISQYNLRTRRYGDIKG
ncbi:undecaprenyl diphosphate synthase [Pullulanibacillus pueri]|uniref:Isoprenyl transferase n=1 Tax=Pullulanibacillus pueri TaxID=1437324 RepID=A0A8J3EM77_9BACL|nr:isoprenyl transferase [Pullulanibacillus pueri]MBM7682508.1 undecaprenyl diphosphate synthase [Pullulanibacillus pueri]GGH82118.1 isoprenyl transferase [Pullulanibacillus pueri]